MIVVIDDGTDEVIVGVLSEEWLYWLIITDGWIVVNVLEWTDEVYDIRLEGDSDLSVVTGVWVIDDAEVDIPLEGDSNFLVVNDGWIVEDVGGGTDDIEDTTLEGDLDWLVVIEGPEDGLKSFVDAFVFVDTEGKKFGSDVSGVFEVLGFDLLSVVKKNDIEEEIISEVFDFLEVNVKSILSVVCLIEGSIVGVGFSIEERFFPNVVSFSGKFSFKSEKNIQKKKKNLWEFLLNYLIKLYFT